MIDIIKIEAQAMSVILSTSSSHTRTVVAREVITSAKKLADEYQDEYNETQIGKTKEAVIKCEMIVLYLEDLIDSL